MERVVGWLECNIVVEGRGEGLEAIIELDNSVDQQDIFIIYGKRVT